MTIRKLILGLWRRGFCHIVSDKIFLQGVWFIKFGKYLDLDNPVTFNEKLQWLKLYDRKPEYTRMVDKYEAKKYVASIIGEEHIIPTLGVWDSFDKIDFDKLPNRFVLKTTHDSGGVVICKDKTTFDHKAAKKKLNKSLKHDYYATSKEWPYKDVKRRILAEEYMVDESGYELKDYKIFCFGGKPELMFIASDRQVEGEETKFDFYDMTFEHLPFTNGHPNASHSLRCPETFRQMQDLATKLSAGLPHVRVDFYDINGKVYFGELTFSHWSGLVPFNPEKWDRKLGKLIQLPQGGGM